MKTVIAKLQQILTDNHADLHDVFQESIGDISNRLLQAGIITRDVQRSNSYDKIISQFVGGMTFKRTLKDLEKHCKNFITALTNVGGPVKSAALMIQQDWIDTVKQEMQIELQLN